MTQDTPWLTRRLIKAGVIAPTIPTYHFAPEANEELDRLCATRNCDGFDFVVPHHHFAFETDTWDMEQEQRTGVRVSIRCVTYVTDTRHNEALGKILQESRTQRGTLLLNATPYLVTDFRHSNGQTVQLPFATMSECGQTGMFDATHPQALYHVRQLCELARHLTAEHNKHSDYALHALRPEQLSVEQYNRLSMQTARFTFWAAHLLAQPPVSTETRQATVRIRGAAARKDREVKVQWNHVTVDLARAASAQAAREEEASRHGVALHQVRSHLRKTRFGTVTVRAHQRGSAEFGVRHRTATVTRGVQ